MLEQGIKDTSGAAHSCNLLATQQTRTSPNKHQSFISKQIGLELDISAYQISAEIHHGRM